MIELITILFGLSFGSFANNLITFYLRGKFDWLQSRCPECDVILKWYEVIPLFSYLILKGRCSHCRVIIPLRYFIVESGCALLALFSLFHWSPIDISILYFFFFTTLFILSVIDFYTLRLPNILLGFLFVLTLIITLVEKTIYLHSFLFSLLLVLVFLSVNYFYRKKRNRNAIGEGDIKLMAILSLISGFPLTLFSLWIAAFLALILLILQNGFSILKSDKKFAFGPFLSVAYTIVIIFSVSITNFLNNFIAGYE